MKLIKPDADVYIHSDELDKESRLTPEPRGRSCAGLVFITHGFNVGISGEPKWTGAMQKAITRRLWSNGRRGRIAVTGEKNNLALKLSWLDPDLSSTTDSDVVIRLDWTAVSNHLISRVSTQEIAAAIARLFCSQPEGLPDLSKIPIHLIGHSRGASLVSELARLLGDEDINVDQMTTLDPHPLSDDDPQPTVRDSVIDAPVNVHPNIGFADNYWQNISYPKGKILKDAYNRCWSHLPGAYHFSVHTAFADHMNLIMLYHATISSESPLGNGETILKQAQRELWFTKEDQLGMNTGYLFSRAIRPELRPDANA